jgi:FKBP-type peptidyl-prolyl cis-trans isomerase FkpA
MHEPNCFRPVLLPLEDRSVPAGAMLAQMVNGTLIIDGDESANSLVISGTGWRSVALRAGDSDTVINGRTPGEAVFFGGITRGIVVRANNGEDTIRLDQVKNRHYIGVDGGGGEDEVVLDRVEARGTVAISTGDADDLVVIQNSRLRGLTGVNLGAGEDTLEITRSNVRGRTQVNGADGTSDVFRTDGSSFARTIQYQNVEQRLVGPKPPPPPPPVLPPSVLISSSSGESSADASIPFTVSFSAPVGGFTLDDLGVTNGTPSNLQAINATDFTFDVVPAEDGSITVNVPANVATDDIGRGNTAADPLTVRSIRTDDGMTDDRPAPSDPNFVPTGSGLAVWEIQTGNGQVVTPDNGVQVFYTGWLTDDEETVFDSARTTGQPASFSLSGLIAGFREGLIGMQPGGIRRFLIPPELGYGSTGSGSSIPPNATLIFEVKLVKVT